MKRKNKHLSFILAICVVLSLCIQYLPSYATNNIDTHITEISTATDATQTDAATATDADFSNNTDTSAEQAAPLINCLIIGHNSLNTAEEQYIVIDVSCNEKPITTATLSYKHTDTGNIVSVPVNTILDTTLLFTFIPEVQGEYSIIELCVTADNSTHIIDISGTGIDARFGVDTYVETTPDDIICENEVDEEATGVIITDLSTGENLESSDVAEAIADVSISGRMTSSLNDDLIIVIDPGHGNNGDPGAVYTWNNVTYIERDINLTIAKYCKERLEQYGGVTVYLTRTDNSSGLALSATDGQELGEIVQFAKDKNADLLVSIHNNASTNSNTHGSEVYYPNSNYNSSISLDGKGIANKVLENLVTLGLYNRGAIIKNSQDNTLYPDGSLADYYGIVRQSKLAGFPGIIVEHAYMSNSSDAITYLGSDAALKELGYADADAIAEYFGITSYSTVYNGVDYSKVFDFNYYRNAYPDIKATYGYNAEAILKHFVLYGINEGRRGNANFDVYSYKNGYSDLRQAYGNNLKSYYTHYIHYGYYEGRTATGITSLQNPVTTYNGVNYSKVYDYNYYISVNPDVAKVYGNDDVATLKHFVNYGMAEGRRAKASFDVYSYKNAYLDLRKAYGNNLKSYYTHYMLYGYKEGRITTNVTNIQNPATIYNGVDYSSVYDYYFYTNNHPDIKKAYGNDDVATLKHFVNYGMAEGRQAKSSFNVFYYKNNYIDLFKAYGNNLSAYYKHYMYYGIKECRVANKQILTSIMAPTDTTVAQMVAYYTANATYPSYYATSDAPSIEDFCQIYIDECAAEGVNASIAFCQAMKETGFLRYGGAVTINQYNFAGLGATDDGGTPASFSSVREGIRAQVQHLKAYASCDSLNNACVDPRFSLVTRGTAPYVQWLGINENPYGRGWASAINYGYSILNDYVSKLKLY